MNEWFGRLHSEQQRQWGDYYIIQFRFFDDLFYKGCLPRPCPAMDQYHWHLTLDSFCDSP